MTKAIAMLMDNPEGVPILELKYESFGKGCTDAAFNHGLKDLFELGLAYVVRYDEKGRPVIALQKVRFEKPNAPDPVEKTLKGLQRVGIEAFMRQRLSYAVTVDGVKVSLSAACRAAGIRPGLVYGRIYAHGKSALTDALVQKEFQRALDQKATGEYKYVPLTEEARWKLPSPKPTVFSMAPSVFNHQMSGENTRNDHRLGSAAFIRPEGSEKDQNP
jgi:hypothetical protein